MDDLGFGERLRELREARGITREELVERVGSGNQKTVWVHECGRKDPLLATVRRYAAALEVSVVELVRD